MQLRIRKRKLSALTNNFLRLFIDAQQQTKMDVFQPKAFFSVEELETNKLYVMWTDHITVNKLIHFTSLLPMAIQHIILFTFLIILHP